MDQDQVIPIGGEMPAPRVAPAAIVPIGGEMSAPTFRSSNEKDEQGNALVRGIVQFYEKSPIAGVVNAVGGTYNAVRHPLDTWLGAIPLAETAKNLIRAQWDQGVQAAQKAKQAAAEAKGDLQGKTVANPLLTGMEALGHGMAAILPLIGPMAADVGEHGARGDLAGMVGGAGGLLTPFAVPKVVDAVRKATGVVPKALAPKLNPAEAASNTFAETRGVPLDAATATGSRTLRAMQKRVANSMGGEGTASELIDQQRQALGRVGGELATETKRLPVTPEQAGEAVKNAITQRMRDLHQEANDAYGKVREAESQISGQVPKTEAPAVANARKLRQQASLGGATVTDAELNELRNIRDELEAQPYQAGKLVSDDPGLSSGAHYTRRVGNANVFQDIGQASGSNESAAAMIRSIDSAIETGNFTSIGRGALDVARKRLAGDKNVSSGWTKPGTRSASAAEGTQTMALPVDLRLAKESLAPVYERLKREGELAPLMGGKADALRALDRIVNGPDHAPLSTADGALSDLKAMARSDVPELRGAGKGTAAFAVRQLDGAINMAMEQASPETLQALERGRVATRAKYQAGDVLQSLRDEPVQTFRQMTAPADSGIKLLRRVQQLAPKQMSSVARGWLEQQLSLAGQEGGFGHGARLWSDWNRLGRETKRVLFPKAGQVEALDQFFLLAKRIEENPNPSGTAHTLSVLNVTSSPVMLGLAKLLYTPRGVRAVNRFLRVSAIPTRGTAGLASTKAGRAAAIAELAAAAKDAGVSLPLAADRDDQR